VAAVVFVSEHLNALVALGELPGGFDAAVGRGVIDDQHVDVHTFLRQDTANARFEVATVVVAGDDNTDSSAGWPSRQTYSPFR
jgi:hypothetical protein